jgi:hypothetical protein
LKPLSPIETECCCLTGSRLEPAQSKSALAGLSLNSRKQRPSRPTAAGDIADVHAL